MKSERKETDKSMLPRETLYGERVKMKTEKRGGGCERMGGKEITKRKQSYKNKRRN